MPIPDGDAMDHGHAMADAQHDRDLMLTRIRERELTRWIEDHRDDQPAPEEDHEPHWVSGSREVEEGRADRDLPGYDTRAFGRDEHADEWGPGLQRWSA